MCFGCASGRWIICRPSMSGRRIPAAIITADTDLVPARPRATTALHSQKPSARVAFWPKSACRCRRRTCFGKLRNRCSGQSPEYRRPALDQPGSRATLHAREDFRKLGGKSEDGLGLAHGGGPGRVLSISPGKMRLGSISSFGRMRRAVSFRKKSSRRKKSARTSRYTACGRPGGLDLTAKTYGNSSSR